MTTLAASLSSAIGARAREWARKRQGPDSASTRLESRRIYILPTRAGFIFGLIVFTMLLGSMNYNNNMGFALTFLLASIGVISIHHCHRNLTDIWVHYLGAQPVFAGDFMVFRFALENRGMAPRWQVQLSWDDDFAICNEISSESREAMKVRVRATARGYFDVPRIKVSTRFPLGLLHAWTWINLDAAELVYPRPADRLAHEPFSHDGHTASGHRRIGDEDFSGLRDYRRGDPPKHVAWKALARTGDMLVTEYRSGDRDQVWIDWDEHPLPEVEARLAALTRRVLDAAEAGHRFGLRLPTLTIPPGSDAAHRHECLRALALFRLPDPDHKST